MFTRTLCIFVCDLVAATAFEFLCEIVMSCHVQAKEDLATGAQHLVGTPSLVDSAPVDTVKVSPQEMLVDKAAVIKGEETTVDSVLSATQTGY